MRRRRTSDHALERCLFSYRSLARRENPCLHPTVTPSFSLSLHHSFARQIFLNKYVKTGIHDISADSEVLSPGIRQTLLHWAFSPTTAHLSLHAKKMSGEIVPGSAPLPASKNKKGKGRGKARSKGRGRGWEEDSDGEKRWDTEEEGVPEGEEEKIDDRGPKEPERE